MILCLQTNGSIPLVLPKRKLWTFWREVHADTSSTGMWLWTGTVGMDEVENSKCTTNRPTMDTRSMDTETTIQTVAFRTQHRKGRTNSEYIDHIQQALQTIYLHKHRLKLVGNYLTILSMARHLAKMRDNRQYGRNRKENIRTVNSARNLIPLTD
jgi:hypothetical protein